MRRALVFLVLVVAADRLIGTVFAHFDRRMMIGERGGLLNYALTKDAQVLVLGSSRAQYHVMPAVLRKKLSLSAYNAGLKGHDFLYAVMLFDLWQRRHPAPRVILLHIDIESMLERKNELAAAQIFGPYISESPLVREVLYSADPYKRLEYLSDAYRFNGRMFVIARNLVLRNTDPDSDGFRAATDTLDVRNEPRTRNALDHDHSPIEYARMPFDENKIRYLRQLAGYAIGHHTRLFLLHTPRYDQDSLAHRIWVQRIRRLIDDIEGTELIDICEATQPETFARHPHLFNDVNHLNARGALVLSEMLAAELSDRLGGP